MEELDPPVDGAQVLAALLERSGAEFRREGARFCLLFTQRGCKWQTVCDCREGRILVYGVHPARVSAPETALALCSELNGRTVRGAFFVQEGHIVFRTGAELTDRYSAAERAASALEYNAAAVSGFWTRLAAGAAGRLLD